MSVQSEYRRLRGEAIKSCENRGHEMKRFEFHPYWTNDERVVASSVCLICDMMVEVDTSPPPNGIDIGGEAVALNCGNIGGKW